MLYYQQNKYRTDHEYKAIQCFEGEVNTTLLKKFTSKVDGFTFGTNLLMVITSEVKVFMTFWFYYVRRYYLLREVA